MADADKLSPLWEMTVSRMKEFVRDPAALFWTFGFPVVLAVALGLAFRSAPPPAQRVALVCEQACDGLLRKLDDAAQLDVKSHTLAEALKRMSSGKVDLVVQALHWDDQRQQLRFHQDPTHPEARTARLAVEVTLGAGPAFEVDTREHDEPGGRYIDFLIPGLIGLNVMSSALWGTSFSIVDQRKRKLLKQLAATPMRRSHFLLSYMFSRLVFLIAEVVFLLGFGHLAFGVPLRGSFFAVAVLALCGSLSFAGLGLLVASRADSTEAAGGWANFAMLPMWLLSGAFFTYERFPEYLHGPIQMLPLTALNDSLRAVTNEGAALWTCAPQLLVMAAWGVVCFAMALRLFRWQ